mmetsp:Transcript_48390/g.118463  ORF Transcript_48390/g.118463 Transcript_48390/m.118463 type:complete len:110 (+) Transcript_48390:94-423(+)
MQPRRLAARVKLNCNRKQQAKSSTVAASEPLPNLDSVPKIFTGRLRSASNSLLFSKSWQSCAAKRKDVTLLNRRIAAGRAGSTMRNAAKKLVDHAGELVAFLALQFLSS